jgi:hypothetical protein
MMEDLYEMIPKRIDRLEERTLPGPELKRRTSVWRLQIVKSVEEVPL